MSVTLEQIATICNIAHETSFQGSGRSLREAMNRSAYRELRTELDEAAVVHYLGAHPEVVSQWELFSDNKRTRGGWYFRSGANGWTVGRVTAIDQRSDERTFATAADACAHFIIQELDFWDRSMR